MAYYNNNHKLDFLEYLKEEEGIQTLSVYEVLFKKSAELENKLSKDLYDFNTPEAEYFMRSLGSSSKLTIRANLGYIKKYIDFSSTLKWGNMDGFNDMDATELANKIVVSYKVSMFTREELLELMEEHRELTVFHRLMLLAIFEGIKGTSNSELLAMRFEDLEVKGDRYFFNIHTFDKNTRSLKFERKVEISKELARIIKEASRTTELTTRHPDSKQSKTIALNESPYLIKTAYGNKVGEMATAAEISRQYTFIQDLTGNTNIRPKDIFSSGIGCYLTDLTQDIEADKDGYKTIGIDTWKIVAKKYNIAGTAGRALREFEKEAFKEKFGKFKVTTNKKKLAQ